VLSWQAGSEDVEEVEEAEVEDQQPEDESGTSHMKAR
jgi:hypothetical protein